MSETEIIVRDQVSTAVMSPKDVKNQVQQIQQVMKDCMKEGSDEATGHYGKIPGCGEKMVLFKAGAEKLSMMFHLVPDYSIQLIQLQDDHREYQITCTLTHSGTGNIVGQGVGLCSTMESKYRYRRGDSYTVLDIVIPRDSKEKKVEYRKKGFGMKKHDGEWRWVKFNKSDRDENPDIADVFNTVLKMAKKRAHVDAVLTATAASDIFTQDLEDAPPEDAKPAIKQPKAKTTTKKEPEKKDEAKNSDPIDLVINDAQLKLLMTTYKESGITEAVLRTIVKDIAGVTSTKDIAPESLDDVLYAIKKEDVAAE